MSLAQVRNAGAAFTVAAMAGAAQAEPNLFADMAGVATQVNNFGSSDFRASGPNSIVTADWSIDSNAAPTTVTSQGDAYFNSTTAYTINLGAITLSGNVSEIEIVDTAGYDAVAFTVRPQHISSVDGNFPAYNSGTLELIQFLFDDPTGQALTSKNFMDAMQAVEDGKFQDLGILNAGSTGANWTIDNFSLTVVPAPASATLLAASGLYATRRRRDSAPANDM